MQFFYNFSTITKVKNIDKRLADRFSFLANVTKLQSKMVVSSRRMPIVLGTFTCSSEKIIDP